LLKKCSNIIVFSSLYTERKEFLDDTKWYQPYSSHWESGNITIGFWWPFFMNKIPQSTAMAGVCHPPLLLLPTCQVATQDPPFNATPKSLDDAGWLYQWPFQDPKMEVPTIYKAYIRPM
jgi:hypothetical protein